MAAASKKSDKKTKSMKAAAAAATASTSGAARSGGKSKKENKSLVTGILAAVSALILVVAVAFVFNVGSLAKGAIEKLATSTLGVKVTIGSLDIQAAEKTVTVKGLDIANPAGFQKSSAFAVDSIAVTGESFSPELLVFKRIVVEGAAVNVEVTQDSTNLAAIRNNVSGRTQEASESLPDGAKNPPKVIIRELVLNGTSINPSSALVEGEMKPMQVSAIRVTGIGEGENGVQASEAVAQVYEQITSAVMQTALGAGYLQGMAPEALGSLKQQFGIADGVVDQAKQGLDSITNGIMNMFGGGGQ